jgi:DNA invertase Pin-like site-specific DNA recombinase
MKTCFAYVRVSSVKQGEGASLEAQRRVITEYATANRLTITQWFEELETAAKTSRPIFTDMVKRLHRGEVGGLICHRVDRASRNFRNWADIGELADAGIEIHFATESLDFNSRGGRLVADIQMAVASDYCRNLSIEARKGIDQRLREGLYPGPAPVGYLNNGRGQLKTKCPLRAPFVRTLFELYLTEDYSIRSLHREMVARDLTTTGGRPISRRTIENILGNPFYCGILRNKRTGEHFHGKHEPILSQAEFDRVQTIKAGKYVKKQVQHEHPFRRLLYCAECSGLLTPERQKQKYTYYRCHTKGCPVCTVREETVEEAVSAALTKIAFSDDDIAYLRQKYETWDYPAKIREEQRQLELRLNDVTARQEKLLGLLLDETIDKATYQMQKGVLSKDAAKLQLQIATVGQHHASPADLEAFFELMKSVHGLYKTAKPRVQRGLIQSCFSNRTFDGKTLCFEPSEELVALKAGSGDPFSAKFRDIIRNLVTVIERVGSRRY